MYWYDKVSHKIDTSELLCKCICLVPNIDFTRSGRRR
jgi:hypothetical protein